MKAVRIHQYGNVDTLRYEDADEPAVRADDVLIRVVGTSVNPVDWKIRQGLMPLTPGIESPTISPLRRGDWSAVRAMVKRTDINRIMDDLWKVGARGILVTDIHACRL